MIRFLRLFFVLWVSTFFPAEALNHEAPVSVSEGDAFSSAIFFSWEVFPRPVLAGPQGTNEENFREIIVYKLEMYCSSALATASCDCTTSTVSVTPPLKRSRDCASV